jgi:hypoxanthine phosphoribosyltransferase
MVNSPIQLISRTKIQKRVRELARQFEKDYRNKKPVLVGVLKGAFIFMADLIRFLDIPAEFDFIAVASYGAKKSSSGKVKLLKDISLNIKNKDIIVVEDIIDTGLSTKFIIKKLKRHSPKSIRFCVLLDKPERRKVKVKIDYCGFKVPNKFIVGYGLDYNGRYRNLPYIGYVEAKN